MAEKFRRSWLSIVTETAFLVALWVVIFYGIPGSRHWANSHGLLTSVLTVIFILCEMFTANHIAKRIWERRHG